MTVFLCSGWLKEGYRLLYSVSVGCGLLRRFNFKVHLWWYFSRNMIICYSVDIYVISLRDAGLPGAGFIGKVSWWAWSIHSSIRVRALFNEPWWVGILVQVLSPCLADLLNHFLTFKYREKRSTVVEQVYNLWYLSHLLRSLNQIPGSEIIFSLMHS